MRSISYSYNFSEIGIKNIVQDKAVELYPPKGAKMLIEQVGTNTLAYKTLDTKQVVFYQQFLNTYTNKDNKFAFYYLGDKLIDFVETDGFSVGYTLYGLEKETGCIVSLKPDAPVYAIIDTAYMKTDTTVSIPVRVVSGGIYKQFEPEVAVKFDLKLSDVTIDFENSRLDRQII